MASKLIGLRFENANGADIDFFPGFCLIQESKEHDYALIDLCDIDLRFAVQRFIEDDELPKDALIIGHAWEKSNKDGSPDRRFRNNRQLPIMGYGQLEFRTNQGLNEAYMISDQERAKQFAIAFIALQNSLRSSSSKAAEIDTLGSPQTLVEPASEYQIPDLPNTPGAHEYTLGAFAIAGTLAWWGLTSSPHVLAPALPIPQSVATTAPDQRPPASTAGVRSVTPAGNLPAPANAKQPVLVEQVVTLQRANLRTEPSTSAAVIRTVAPGVTFRVFRRNIGWVQVGNEQPAGWIGETLLGPTPTAKH